MKKILLVLIGGAVLAEIILIIAINFIPEPQDTAAVFNFTPQKGIPQTAVLYFTGDIMLSRSVGNKMALENNYNWPFLKIAKYLKAADLTTGNLESPISNRGTKVGSIYSFRADPKVITGLNLAGFDLLSVANNHIGDYTRTAMEDTLNILKENNIDYLGGGFNEIEAHSAVIKEINKIKIAFLAYTALGTRYTEAKGEVSGIAWLDQERMAEDIKKAKEKSDFLIVFIHFGEEYQKTSNNFQKSIAHLAIDKGANLVVGHHPHVVQEIEQYKNGYIAYSLGNFVFDQLFSQETMEGMILKVILDSDKNMEIEPIKTKNSRDFQVELAQ